MANSVQKSRFQGAARGQVVNPMVSSLPFGDTTKHLYEEKRRNLAETGNVLLIFVYHNGDGAQ